MYNKKYLESIVKGTLKLYEDFPTLNVMSNGSIFSLNLLLDYVIESNNLEVDRLFTDEYIETVKNRVNES